METITHSPAIFDCGSLIFSKASIVPTLGANRQGLAVWPECNLPVTAYRFYCQTIGPIRSRESWALLEMLFYAIAASPGHQFLL